MFVWAAIVTSGKVPERRYSAAAIEQISAVGFFISSTPAGAYKPLALIFPSSLMAM